ncbi:bifunctional diaminohydroxyphosphoribosylaminopyrimidine deaminase/5-amino-6-(5-phosphoribosylamino)uracil reductase RibD [Megamonas funiformis]|jgi:diaminohydroxyphosphoribosylaminopyrimidine deaminase/5-amino-6-(5-phosphoribosylamino)uracil reductase|uniref:bifunctional diaminohydroxyphosphoribosylaminopyrimidine deaminase/5-amino-6-(5-phosphoribosylamino)uracil reductase RibD n=1 Tax=Megamonas funiformis TaxID=437897 RepID=UPI000E3EE5BB|nr:bifunctional diaminohydroxyphosphoribosylaminopyrimidine deaminase/5-amino-6-(5-phosphoribosylamino)uracil reductase RibD [Megamonas funiformis]RGJ98059.1 bifunctional diaminohydroxyphosphoribosylaminopyrimidine deaminase/5-amino-6-(5-phosphoribosylamino)uracil reductase RibD [Megamonas funiformis]RHG10261.1 bifunctional diaminohydroxyphosphoribosylaminopyrimidine deaminase/5-amino-6-(5-phosphoribosylamino)uracil reductase RibD [Megamonas funiformis]
MNRKNGDFLSYDEKYMRLAMQLAGNAIGRTSPNPLVGAVIVKDNRVVGCGWHRKAGTPHAEVHALNQAGELAQGADVYVTLEPCAHYGKTPPCAKALVEAKVKNVYGGLLDVNPKVAGKGFKILEDAGIHVEYGFLQDELRKQNEVFFKWIEHKKPFIVLKAAMTLDGKIATATGQSKWITNETSRAYGYKLRDIYDGIMVGINTVIEDNPMLTARVDGGKNPIRIVVDSSLKIDINANVVQDKSAKTIIATTDKANKDKILKLQAQDVDVIVVDKDENDKVDIEKLLDILGQQNICSILVEGGATLSGSFVAKKLVDKVYFFIAPKIIGGKEAKTPVAGTGILNLQEALALKDIQIEKLEEDVLIIGRVDKDKV